MMLPIYALISAVISLVFVFTTQMTAFGLVYMIPIILTLLFMIRIYDDISDFEKDEESKEQPLAKKELIILGAVLTIIFATLNILSFGLFGLISLFVPVYIVLEEKITFLKALFLPLMVIYFYFASCTDIRLVQAVVIGVSVLFAVAYILIKRRKRK